MTKTNGTVKTIAQVILLFALGAAWQTTVFGGGNENSAAPTGFGHPGKSEDVSRTIKIIAEDMKFIPATLDVKAGETVRFVVINNGPSKHEFVIGEDAADHAEEDVMEDLVEEHEEAGETNEIELAVGETRELVWTFTSPREIEFACHQPGHYEAGMLGTIGVQP